MATTEKPRVNLDLDNLDRSTVRSLGPVRDPFVVTLGGREVTFKDAADIDSIVLMTLMDTPTNFFKGALEEDDYKHVMSIYQTPKAFPGWKLRALMDGYGEHYGIDERGNVYASRR